jgi:hypothetical protein
MPSRPLRAGVAGANGCWSGGRERHLALAQRAQIERFLAGFAYFPGTQKRGTGCTLNLKIAV